MKKETAIKKLRRERQLVKEYEAMWKAHASASANTEHHLRRQIRWLAEQLERVELAMIPVGFISQTAPRDASVWIYAAERATGVNNVQL